MINYLCRKAHVEEEEFILVLGEYISKDISRFLCEIDSFIYTREQIETE